MVNAAARGVMPFAEHHSSDQRSRNCRVQIEVKSWCGIAATPSVYISLALGLSAPERQRTTAQKLWIVEEYRALEAMLSRSLGDWIFTAI